MNSIEIVIVGVLLIIISAVCWLWLEKRKVSRTSSGGVEEFKSYGSLWKSRIIELVIRIIMYIFLAIGTILALSYFLFLHH